MSNRYPKYAESGAPWIGAIPDHWSVDPLGSVLVQSKVKNSGMIESNLLSLSYGRIVRKSIDSNDGLLPESFETYQIVEPDHIVFRFTDLQNDQRSLRSARVTERGIITSAYVSARPVGVEGRYADFLMRSYDTAKVFYGLGGGLRQSLKYRDVARLPFLRPPPAEQRAIADYLDRETARIDTLIEEQQRLIEMLGERRNAVISGAFTDKAANSRIQHACLDVVDCPHTTPEVFEEGLFEAVRTASVRAGKYRPGQGLRVTRDTWATRNAGGAPKVGDILFTREAPAGEACMVPSEDICLGQRMVLLRIDARVCVGEFLLWQLYADRVQDYFRLAVNGTTVGNVRLPVLRSTPIWLPPIDQQGRIADYLDEQTAKIDTLIAETEAFVELARERRSALITAAVTGQIDVREVS